MIQVSLSYEVSSFRLSNITLICLYDYTLLKILLLFSYFNAFLFFALLGHYIRTYTRCKNITLKYSFSEEVVLYSIAGCGVWRMVLCLVRLKFQNSATINNEKQEILNSFIECSYLIREINLTGGWSQLSYREFSSMTLDQRTLKGLNVSECNIIYTVILIISIK